MIWLLIAQGFAQHVKSDAESLRGRFVSHQGRELITVRRDEFIRGFAGNDREGVFSEFSDKIRGYVGPRVHGSVVPHFSTTSIVETAAFEVTLMDAMQKYFEYDLLTLCGIPEVTLEGTPDDWETIRSGAEVLLEYDLEWWGKGLLPVLDQFVRASHGDIDLLFWRNFYKGEGGSGGPYITGHIINLFPYLIDERLGSFRNKLISANIPVPPYTSANITNRSIPSPLSVAPFLWKYYNEVFAMDFVAGFVSAAQDPSTLAIRPEIGWAVLDRRDGEN